MILTDPKAINLICSDVEPHEVEELKKLLEDELLRAKNGIGLACPQLGIAKKMAIVRIPRSHTSPLSIDLVNPKIIHQYDPFIFPTEGCLSFPDMWVKSRRFKEIEVETALYPHRIVATELLAVAIQHEMDHLIGRLLPEIALK